MTGRPAETPLPRLLVLTDRRICSRPLPDVVSAAVEGGARAVVLREKDLPDAERRRLADALRALLAPVDGLLVLAGPRLPGRAVHLAAADALPSPRPPLVGRSCHGAAEVAAAAAQRCDLVTVSPLRETATKPGYGPPLGLGGLAALAALVPAVDETARAEARERQLRLTKPAGALGRLEDLSVWLSGIQGRCPPRPLERVRVVVFAGDHGIARAGVSAYPPEVTAQMVRNFLAGGAAVNVLARRAGAGVRVVDMAVDDDLADEP